MRGHLYDALLVRIHHYDTYDDCVYDSTDMTMILYDECEDITMTLRRVH